MKPKLALPAALAAAAVAAAGATGELTIDLEEPTDRRRAQGIFNVPLSAAANAAAASAADPASSSAAATANEAPPPAEPAAPVPELQSGGAFTLEEFISSASSASDPFAASEVDDEGVPAPVVASSPVATAAEAAPASGAGGVPVVELGFDGAEVDLSSLSPEEIAALLEWFPPPASSAAGSATESAVATMESPAPADADESVVGVDMQASNLDEFISSAATAQDAFAATEVQGGGAAASSAESAPDVAEDVGHDSSAPPAQTSQGSSLPAGWGQGDSLAPPVQAAATEYDLDLAAPVVDRPAGGPPPAYTDEACARWLSGLLAADFDNSGGVSEAEFVTFLRTINEPPAVANYLKQRTNGAYADLPWLLQLVHKTLACRCEDLGKGEGCCEGDEPEIPLDGLGTDWRQSGGAGGAGGPMGDMTPQELQMAAEYRADACNLIDVVFQETVPATEPPAPVPAPVPASTIDGASGGEEDEQLVQAVPSDPTDANEPATTPVQGPGPGAAPGSAPAPAPPVAIVDAVGSVLAYDEHENVTVQEYRLGVVPNARAVRLDSASAGKALDHVSSAFVDLANKVMLDYGWQAELDAAAKDTRAADVEGGGGRRRIRGLQQEQEKAMLPGGSYVALPPAVTDAVCPSGLAYAPSPGYCLNFKFEVHTPNRTEEFATVFKDKMTEEIDRKGGLYKIVEADYPNTIVQGLGRPGSGVDGTAREVDAPQVDAPQQEGVSAEKPEEMEKHWTDDLPIPIWAMVLIALAVVLIPMVIIALYLRRRKRAREVDSERSFRGASDPYKRDIEAPPVAEMNAIHQESSERMNQKVEMRREISVLVQQTNQSMSSRQLLDAYDGKEEVLLSHLRRVKENQETDAAASSNSPGAPGAGQKKEVATSAGSAAGVEKSKKEEVTKLVEANDIPQTADELLAAYKGNEDTLINHLKKLSSSKLKDSTPKDSAAA